VNIAVKLIVKGRVQGVGYRYFAMRGAKALGLNGYVKNLFNNDVEVWVEGDDKIIEQFIQLLKKGSGFSRVENIEKTVLLYENKFNDFNVTF